MKYLYYITIQNYIREFIPAALLFYKSMRDEHLEYIYVTLLGDREYRKLEMKNRVMFRNKNKYLAHYHKLKLQLIMLSEGNNKEKFLL